MKTGMRRHVLTAASLFPYSKGNYSAYLSLRSESRKQQSVWIWSIRPVTVCLIKAVSRAS